MIYKLASKATNIPRCHQIWFAQPSMAVRTDYYILNTPLLQSLIATNIFTYMYNVKLCPIFCQFVCFLSKEKRKRKRFDEMYWCGTCSDKYILPLDFCNLDFIVFECRRVALCCMMRSIWNLRLYSGWWELFILLINTIWTKVINLLPIEFCVEYS